MHNNVPTHLKILIAEDDRGHFALVKKNLWRTCIDAEILHFPDGRQLLDYLHRRNTGHEQFEKGSYLLLLDIKMPGLDGFDVLAQIRQTPGLRNLPVIMLTTTGTPQEIDRCYALGCSFYIVKPSDYSRFMDTIEHLGRFLCLAANRFAVMDPDTPAT